jgi:hypothetical protein
VKEWIVQLPHPDTLGAGERELYAAEAQNLLELEVPPPAKAVSESSASATLPFSGGVYVASSLGNQNNTVYLNSSMLTSEMAWLLSTLPGVRQIGVEMKGWSRREVMLTVTFTAENYLLATLPKLSIVGNDLNGVSSDFLQPVGAEVRCMAHHLTQGSRSQQVLFLTVRPALL